MFYLEVDDIVAVHDYIVMQTDGLAGLRDKNLLASAIMRPRTTIGGDEVYEDVFAKAAALLEAIANYHPFIDGNKRTSVAAASLYLFAHGISLKFTNTEYEELALKVVAKEMTVVEISKWLKNHTEVK
jgi:death-on-curing protein